MTPCHALHAGGPAPRSLAFVVPFVSSLTCPASVGGARSRRKLPLRTTRMIAAVDGDPTLTNDRERELSRSRDAFINWGACNAIPIECIEPDGSDGGACPRDEFLSYLGEAVSSASVVLLSEGYHNCREMMTLHHHIVQHLVANFGFDIVGSESGLPESRDVAEYVASPERECTETEKEEMWGRGLDKMYGAWAEGRELIEWMREYNLHAKDENARDRIGYCGLDIGGFYANWSYPVSKIQHYLKDQLPAFEAEWSRKIEPILAILGKEKARYNYQHLLSRERKSALAVLLDELVMTLQSCNERLAWDLDFEWARRSAISMQLAENYYRNYEQMSISDSGEGISKCTGLNGREIAMANNMMWRLNLGDDRKMVIINHVIHTKTATQFQDGVWGHFVPMGQLMKQLLASEGKELFNVGMVYGSGSFWNKWQKPDERFVDAIPPPKGDGLEVVMKQISKDARVTNFFLHWEKAPKEARLYLDEVTTIRENDYYIKANPLEWNGCIYLADVSPATPAGIQDKM